MPRPLLGRARSRCSLLLYALILTGCAALAGQQGAAPPKPAPGALKRCRWVRVPNVEATLQAVPNADAGQPAVKATFEKKGEERRLLAIETVPDGAGEGVRALVLRYRLRLGKGQGARLALVAYERDGGAWYAIGRRLPTGDGFAEVRLPVARLREAGFSEDPDGKLSWGGLSKAWVGLVLDGPAQGSFELSSVRLTDEPYRPSAPLRITGEGPGAWHWSKDSAVRGQIATPKEGPDGKVCAKFAWTMPGHRHMYAIPHTPVPDEEFGGYRALRFTYKATLPKGIGALFVALQESGGAQYYTDTLAEPTDRWRTLTIPFSALKLGSWSSDANGRLDLEQLASVAIGCHGTAREALNGGTIWVTDIQFVP